MNDWAAAQNAKNDREILDRTRRIETRLTVLAKALGINVGGGTPVWNEESGRIQAPSPNCSLSECLKVIPPGMKDNDIDVYVGHDYLLTIFVEPHVGK